MSSMSLFLEFLCLFLGIFGVVLFFFFSSDSFCLSAMPLWLIRMSAVSVNIKRSVVSVVKDLWSVLQLGQVSKVALKLGMVDCNARC